MDVIEEKEAKHFYNLEIDEHGMPVLSLVEPNWFASLCSASAYYIRRIFKSKQEREDESNAVSHFTGFLSRLRIKLEFDSKTGMPAVSLALDPPYVIGYRHKKKKHKHKRKHDRHVTASLRVPEGDGYILESKHGTVIYQIQQIVVNINAEVVTQLNTNPQEVINLIQDKLQLEVEKKIQVGLTDNSNDQNMA